MTNTKDDFEKIVIHEYIDTGGLNCPVCGAEYSVINTSPMGEDLGRDCRCEECGEEWRELYALVGIER